MLCYAIQYMLCYALSSLGLIRVKIAFQKVNKVFGRNCLLFVFVLCCWTLQGAVDTPLYVSTTYIYSKPYEITFPESTYYIHVYGLWMARPRDLQVACAFTQGFFCNVGANEKHANTCHASFFFLVQDMRKSQWSVQGLFPTSPRPLGKISHYMFGARWCSYML